MPNDDFVEEALTRNILFPFCTFPCKVEISTDFYDIICVLYVFSFLGLIIRV